MGLAGEDYDNPRLVPAAEVKSWFEMLAPGSNSTVGRVSDLWDRLDDAPERLREVRTMASWVDDVVPAPGRLLAELYRKLGPGANGLMKGTATVGDRAVDNAAVAMPVLSVSAEKDTIAPAAGVDAIAKVVPHAEISAAAGRPRRYRRGPLRGRVMEAHGGIPGSRKDNGVQREFIQWQAASHLRLRARRRQTAVPRSRHRLQRRHVAAVHPVLSESANHQFRCTGRRAIEHTGVPRLRQRFGGARGRSARPLRVECTDVIGFSYGGAIAQQLAYDYPERVCKLVLAATNCGLGSVLGLTGGDGRDGYAAALLLRHLLRAAWQRSCMAG